MPTPDEQPRTPPASVEDLQALTTALSAADPNDVANILFAAVDDSPLFAALDKLLATAAKGTYDAPQGGQARDRLRVARVELTRAAQLITSAGEYLQAWDAIPKRATNPRPVRETTEAPKRAGIDDRARTVRALTGPEGARAAATRPAPTPDTPAPPRPVLPPPWLPPAQDPTHPTR
ncbi:hypothetical protein [Streptomyces sp. SID3343]|uniref:hypothetical protein n=1 Tax=Streptomyces sp. SID3343 TaxID=2690260 RepID=UPI00136ED9E5|nr:hypothetical protein [Streptomyces sp. SID3343]MYW03377.1 hypothetical protein [Streptomyces sp. SID3343]MYW06217.1 hypothetical protein [Streptomyces sp. SID3343]